jgi:hypothetical protein
MASNEGIGSPFLKQHSAHSPKLRIYCWKTGNHDSIRAYMKPIPR